MASYDKWIQHLSDPLVLIGFVILILSRLVKLIIKGPSFPNDNEKGLSKKILSSCFILGLLIIVLGFGLSFYREMTRESNSENAISTNDQTSKDLVTHGSQSPIITNPTGSVELNYGEQPESSRKKKAPE